MLCWLAFLEKCRIKHVLPQVLSALRLHLSRRVKLFCGHKHRWVTLALSGRQKRMNLSYFLSLTHESLPQPFIVDHSHAVWCLTYGRSRKKAPTESIVSKILMQNPDDLLKAFKRGRKGLSKEAHDYFEKLNEPDDGGDIPFWRCRDDAFDMDCRMPATSKYIGEVRNLLRRESQPVPSFASPAHRGQEKPVSEREQAGPWRTFSCSSQAKQQTNFVWGWEEKFSATCMCAIAGWRFTLMPRLRRQAHFFSTLLGCRKW